MPELVTAIIPTFNYGRFVARAVTSVLAQTYPNLECIVVDDGSTDDTQEVLRAFGDQIKVIRQPNTGLSAARNRGIAEARGRYIAFLDADDWWSPVKIATQVEWLETHPGVGCVGCGREHVESDGCVSTLAGLPNHRSRRETLRDLAVRAFWVSGSGSGALVRAEVLSAAGGFDESLTAAEDWDLWLRLAALTDIDNVPAVLTTIRRHGTGVFRNVDRMEQNSWAVYEKVTKAWPDLFSFADRRKMRALIQWDGAGECLAQGNRTRALGYLRRSLIEWPFVGRRWRVALATSVRWMLGRSGRPKPGVRPAQRTTQ